MKKLFLFLILLIPIFNINALTLCDSTELPNLPSGINNYNVIIKRTNGYYRLYSFVTNNPFISLSSSNDFVIDTNSTSYVVYNYNPNEINGDWAFLSSGSSNVSLTINSITATNINIYSSSDNSIVLYDSGYNFDCTSPAPIIPNDFSIINTIASYINDLIVSLNNANIGIHEIFIGLVVINLLTFILCYLITHFE